NYDKQEQTDKEVKIISETLQQAVVAVTENQARNHSGMVCFHYSFTFIDYFVNNFGLSCCYLNPLSCCQSHFTSSRASICARLCLVGHVLSFIGYFVSFWDKNQGQT
ncbi:unnamed protein product, partial [Linum tenue]